jgi:hypothetical protein
VNVASGPPLVVVIAGPNGAGKSTEAPELLRHALRVQEFVNADPIALGLSGLHPERAALAAGRVMLARLKTLARLRADFAFETTLRAGRSRRGSTSFEHRATGLTWCFFPYPAPSWLCSEWRNVCGWAATTCRPAWCGGGSARG